MSPYISLIVALWLHEKYRLGSTRLHRRGDIIGVTSHGQGRIGVAAPVTARPVAAGQNILHVATGIANVYILHTYIYVCVSLSCPVPSCSVLSLSSLVFSKQSQDVLDVLNVVHFSSSRFGRLTDAVICSCWVC